MKKKLEKEKKLAKKAKKEKKKKKKKERKRSRSRYGLLKVYHLQLHLIPFRSRDGRNRNRRDAASFFGGDKVFYFNFFFGIITALHAILIRFL